MNDSDLSALQAHMCTAASVGKPGKHGFKVWGIHQMGFTCNNRTAGNLAVCRDSKVASMLAMLSNKKCSCHSVP